MLTLITKNSMIYVFRKRAYFFKIFFIFALLYYKFIREFFEMNKYIFLHEYFVISYKLN